MPVQRSIELARHAEEALDAARAGDDTWFERHTATGEITFFGTAPGQVLRGEDQAVALGIHRASTLAKAADAGAAETEAYEAGDAGWIVTESRVFMSDGSWVPVRAITVLIREEGEWKTVFGATSVLVSDDLLERGSPLVHGP